MKEKKEEKEEEEEEEERMGEWLLHPTPTDQKKVERQDGILVEID